MNDIKGAISKKKTEQKARHGSKSRGKAVDALMASLERSDEDKGLDETPFVSTIVYSDDEEPVEEEATFVNATVNASANAEEQSIAVVPEKKQKPKKNGGIIKRKMTTFTTLVFVDNAGTRYEVELDRRPVTYSELQREIARLHPYSEQMFVVQNERGDKVFSNNYIPSAKLIVREVFYRPPPYKFLKSLGIKFETEGYHDAKFKAEMARVEDE